MQTASSVLRAAVSPQQKRVNVTEPSPVGSSPATSSTESAPRVSEQDMDQVFDAMARMYGAKFTSQWGEYDDGAWLAELTHLPRHCLELGFRRLRQEVSDAARAGDTAWPPQPVAFAAMCEPRPEDVGLPTADAAWREACDHSHDPTGWRWSHEAVRMAGQAVGWREIHGTTAQSVRARLESRFARQYSALVNRVMAGEELTPRHLLEHDSQRTAADLAERAGREAAAQRAEAEGLPDRMNASQGLAMLKAATGRA